MSEFFALYCSQSPGCICEKCLYYWSSRCPYGGCYDDLRAKENPYDKSHPGEPPRTAWSDWKTDQAYWCRGGIFYQTHECEKFVEYDESKSVVKECLDAMVEVYQDGYVQCSLVESVGCEECMKRFEEKMDKKEVKGNNMIQNINITKLHPHIDNPRKDLGDLTELAESIKAKGILQNLTVVPRILGSKTDSPAQDGYTIVIGHRRFAAAKLAGLTELPCTISNMDHREQIETMLLENMQRNDLTVYEQAMGFQMMLELGDTLEEISERTGFSKTTVRHRVQLLKLDDKKFKESVQRGATLMDYAELEKIKDIKRRNKVLDKIGTSNFKWELNNAIEEEEKPARKAALIKLLDEFAKPLKDDKGMEYVQGFHNFRHDDFKKPKDSNKVDYFYTTDQYSATLYKKKVKAEAKKMSQKEIAFHEKEAQLKNLTARAYEMRYEFIKNFTATKKYSKEIAELIAKSLLSYGSPDKDKLLNMLSVQLPDNMKDKGYLTSSEIFGLISSEYSKNPERVMLIATYVRMNDGKANKYYYAQDWNSKIDHSKNENLDLLYDALISLGYEMSDEERAMRDGTHRLFSEVI